MLQRALHGGGEVAAARAALGGMAKGGGTSVRPRAVEKLRSDAWAPARSRRGRAGSPRRRRVALHCTRRRDRVEGLEEGEKGRFEISKISRDLNAKQG